MLKDLIIIGLLVILFAAPLRAFIAAIYWAAYDKLNYNHAFFENFATTLNHEFRGLRRYHDDSNW